MLYFLLNLVKKSCHLLPVIKMQCTKKVCVYRNENWIRESGFLNQKSWRLSQKGNLIWRSCVIVRLHKVWEWVWDRIYELCFSYLEIIYIVRINLWWDHNCVFRDWAMELLIEIINLMMRILLRIMISRFFIMFSGIQWNFNL